MQLTSKMRMMAIDCLRRPIAVIKPDGATMETMLVGLLEAFGAECVKRCEEIAEESNAQHEHGPLRGAVARDIVGRIRDEFGPLQFYEHDLSCSSFRTKPRGSPGCSCAASEVR